MKKTLSPKQIVAIINKLNSINVPNPSESAEKNSTGVFMTQKRWQFVEQKPSKPKLPDGTKLAH